MNAHTRVFESTMAIREKVPLLLGLMGPSGSGKTYSALRLATGIQKVSGGDIWFVDTEAKRAKHYADHFKFHHIDFKSPFSPIDYLSAIQHCMDKGAGVIVVDSMSHEHEGQGGVLEMHEAELDRMAGKDGEDWKRNANNFKAWTKPKLERGKLIRALLQMNCNFIFCFRAKEKVKPGKDDNGKKALINQGWMPIAGEEFIFEQTANMLLLPSSNGVPTWRSEYPGERSMMKLPQQFRGILDQPDSQLTESIGVQLAEWAKGTSPQAQNLNTLELARTAARGGTNVFEVWWKSASKDERADATTIKDELKILRIDADVERKAKGDVTDLLINQEVEADKSGAETAGNKAASDKVKHTDAAANSEDKSARQPTSEEIEKAETDAQEHAEAGRSLRGMPIEYRENQALQDAYTNAFNNVSRG